MRAVRSLRIRNEESGFSSVVVPTPCTCRRLHSLRLGSKKMDLLSQGSNDGGASSVLVPHCLLGVVLRVKSRVPPCSTKLSGSQVLVVGLPFNLRLWM